MALIKRCGEMWARNEKNRANVPGRGDGGQGVYILYDGSMPVYIGMGNIRSRLKQSMRSRLRGQMWDHFSWFVPSDPALMRDIEALLLRTLPFYLRVLNQQGGKLQGVKPDPDKNPRADVIDRKLPRRKSRRRKRQQRKVA